MNSQQGFIRWQSVAPAFVLVMIGCSGSSSSPGTAPLRSGDGGAPNDDPGASIGHPPNAGSDGGSSPTPNPTPSGGDACRADAKDDTCVACTKQSCCSAFAACVGDDACAGLFTCAAHCGDGDEA